MTHFTAQQLGMAVLKMFKKGQKKILYQVSNFIKCNPDLINKKTETYIKKEVSQSKGPQNEQHGKEEIHQESKTQSDQHENTGKSYPTIEAKVQQRYPLCLPGSISTTFEQKERTFKMLEIIKERNNQIAQTVVDKKYTVRKQLNDLTLDLWQTQKRIVSLTNEYELLHQNIQSVMQLAQEIQKRSEIICLACISRRDKQLSPQEGDVLIDRLVECVEKKICEIEVKVDNFIHRGRFELNAIINDDYFM